jgi:hypothetical protein
MPRWTHRKTWPDYSANDRVVLRDWVKVVPVYGMEHGPQMLSWLWFGWWAGALIRLSATGSVPFGGERAAAGGSRDHR